MLGWQPRLATQPVPRPLVAHTLPGKSDENFRLTLGTVLGQTNVKLPLTGRNLGRVFNSTSGCMCAMNLCCYAAKRSSLKLKTRSK
jgi:hypothetical protein